MADLTAIGTGIASFGDRFLEARAARDTRDLNRQVALANIAESGRRTGIAERHITLAELSHKDEEARAKQKYETEQNKEIRKGKLIQELQEAENDLATFENYFSLAEKGVGLEQSNDPVAREEYHNLFADVNSRLEQDGMQLTLHGNFRPIPSTVNQETGEMQPISLAQIKEAQHDAAAAKALAEKELAMMGVNLPSQAVNQNRFQTMIPTAGRVVVVDRETGQERVVDVPPLPSAAPVAKPLPSLLSDEVKGVLKKAGKDKKAIKKPASYEEAVQGFQKALDDAK